MHEIETLKDQQKYLLNFVKTIRVNDEAQDPQQNPQHRLRLMEQALHSPPSPHSPSSSASFSHHRPYPQEVVTPLSTCLSPPPLSLTFSIPS